MRGLACSAASLWNIGSTMTCLLHLLIYYICNLPCNGAHSQTVYCTLTSRSKLTFYFFNLYTHQLSAICPPHFTADVGQNCTSIQICLKLTLWCSSLSFMMEKRATSLTSVRVCSVSQSDVTISRLTGWCFAREALLVSDSFLDLPKNRSRLQNARLLDWNGSFFLLLLVRDSLFHRCKSTSLESVLLVSHVLLRRCQQVETLLAALCGWLAELVDILWWGGAATCTVCCVVERCTVLHEDLAHANAHGRAIFWDLFSHTTVTREGRCLVTTSLGLIAVFARRICRGSYFLEPRFFGLWDGLVILDGLSGLCKFFHLWLSEWLGLVNSCGTMWSTWLLVMHLPHWIDLCLWSIVHRQCFSEGFNERIVLCACRSWGFLSNRACNARWILTAREYLPLCSWALPDAVHRHQLHGQLSVEYRLRCLCAQYFRLEGLWGNKDLAWVDNFSCWARSWLLCRTFTSKIFIRLTSWVFHINRTVVAFLLYFLETSHSLEILIQGRL